MAEKIKLSRKRSVPAGTAGYTVHNVVQLVKGGKHFFDLLLKEIDQAQQSIHIQTYALADDDTGKMVVDALKKAAARKVQIRLLADGYASQKLSRDFINDLKEAGIQFRFFEPLLRSRYFYFGRRLHHKIHVFDGVRAVVGSMNIADRYNDTNGEKSWLDMALYVEGEIVPKLETICTQFWSKRKVKLAIREEILKKAREEAGEEQVAVRVRQNDWVMRKMEVSKSYLALFGSAKESIYIMCSYFLPGKRLMRKLRYAASRGVKIHIVLAGTSDVKTAKFAERYLYRWMLRHNMNVYEYQPTVLHAKLSVADEEFLTLGSYNINGLSAYASIELNLDVKDKKIGSMVKDQIEKIIRQDCKKVDAETYIRKLFTPRQLLYWLSYQMMNFMLMISTFYFKQHD